MSSRVDDHHTGEPTDFSALKEQERENRKNLIINAAERVFTKRPFDQVTMRNIAREAGITPTAIYRYFADKQTLYAEAYIRSNNRLVELLAQVIDNSEALCLEQITTEIIDHFVSEEQNLKMRAHFMIDDSLSVEMATRLAENTRFFVDHIEGHLRQFTDDPESRFIALTYFAALNGILLTYRKVPGKSEEEILANMHRAGIEISRLFARRVLES